MSGNFKAVNRLLPGIALTLLLVAGQRLWGQLAPPNEAGVTMGHIHLFVSNMEIQQRFWAELGAKQVTSGDIPLLQLPGVYIMLKQQDPSGGTVGSVLDHIGLRVKSLSEWTPKWKAAGLKIEEGDPSNGIYIDGPDGVRVQVNEDASLAVPIALDHVHLFFPNASAAQSWYVKYFGARPGTRTSGSGKTHFLTATVPGAEITITEKKDAFVPTSGRSVDHIGFEVKNLSEFIAKLDADGIHTEKGIIKSARNPKVRAAYITDPWGLHIEITEGLVANQ